MPGTGDVATNSAMKNVQYSSCTGKSLSEVLILGSTDLQYDKRLFIDLPVQHMKTTTSSEHVVYINCFLFVFVLIFKTIDVHNMF